MPSFETTGDTASFERAGLFVETVDKVIQLNGLEILTHDVWSASDLGIDLARREAKGAEELEPGNAAVCSV